MVASVSEPVLTEPSLAPEPSRTAGCAGAEEPAPDGGLADSAGLLFFSFFFLGGGGGGQGGKGNPEPFSWTVNPP